MALAGGCDSETFDESSDGNSALGAAVWLGILAGAAKDHDDTRRMTSHCSGTWLERCVEEKKNGAWVETSCTPTRQCDPECVESPNGAECAFSADGGA
jgi:hypothetical protein